MNHFFNFLHNTNNNGFGVMAFGILSYLCFYNVFLFIQNKKTYYLFYSLFAFLNVLQTIALIKNVFVETIFKSLALRNSPLFFSFKTLSFMFFGLFMMAITDFKNENSKFYKQNILSIKITIALLCAALFIDYIYDTSLMP